MSFDWAHSSQPARTGASRMFPVKPEVSLLFQRAERPMLRLLSVLEQMRSGIYALPHSYRLELPSAEGAVRQLVRGVQALSEGRNLFGWSWNDQRRAYDQALPMSPAESLALTCLPLPAVYGFKLEQLTRKPLPVQEWFHDVVAEDVPAGSDAQPSEAPQRHVPIRLMTRAYDAPITRMDNIRRSRVLARMFASGRSIR